MQNSNVTTVKEINTKNAPKNGAKQPTANDLKTQIEKLTDEGHGLMADLKGEFEKNEELKKEVEKVELENATLRANLKAAQEQAKTELEKEKQQIRLEAAKQIELLKKEKEAAIKPTHRTAEEKQKSLESLNKINLTLVRKKQVHQEFQNLALNPDNEQIEMLFTNVKGKEPMKFATPDLVKCVIDTMLSYMHKNITDLERELLNYQI